MSQPPSQNASVIPPPPGAPPPHQDPHHHEYMENYVHETTEHADEPDYYHYQDEGAQNGEPEELFPSAYFSVWLAIFMMTFQAVFFFMVPVFVEWGRGEKSPQSHEYYCKPWHFVMPFNFRYK